MYILLRIPRFKDITLCPWVVAPFKCQELITHWRNVISNVRNWLLVDAMSYPRRTETSATPPWQPQKLTQLLLFTNCFLMPVKFLIHQLLSVQACNNEDDTYHERTRNITWTALCTFEEGNVMTLTISMHHWNSGRMILHFSALKCTTHRGRCLKILTHSTSCTSKICCLTWTL
jgi:hypothetical protein